MNLTITELRQLNHIRDILNEDMSIEKKRQIIKRINHKYVV